MLKTPMLLGAAILCLTGCVSYSTSPVSQDLKMNADQGGLVFLREKTDANPAAVNLSIDGQYLTSLLPGGMSQVAVCAQPVRITAVQTSQDIGYERKLARHGSVFSVRTGAVTYVLVKANNDNLPSLTVMDEVTAKNLLSSTQVQPHTLARVHNQQNCQLAEKSIIPNDDNLSSLSVMDEVVVKNILGDSSQVRPRSLAGVRNLQSCRLAERTIIPVEKSKALHIQQ